MSLPRIPFATAIADPQLFADAWQTLLNHEQRAILKMLYGLPLDAAETRLWHALNGGGQYDALGFLTGVTPTALPPPTREFEEATFIVGRRGTKTTISSFVVAYEALCGGHKSHLRNKRQEPRYLQIAQDLATAKSNLRQHILPFLESSPAGRIELGDPKKSVTADTIRLPSCGLIVVAPPNIKVRGQAVPVCAMDELAFWQKDKEAAAPDYEVENAVTPAMTQFPHRKLLKMSSPWTKEGLLWKAHETGSYGSRLKSRPEGDAYRTTLVLKAPSAVVNPTMSLRVKNPTVAAREYLERRRQKDPEAFAREYLAEFADSVSGFLPQQLLAKAAEGSPRQRPRREGTFYVAAMDPAFKKDAFALCIGHLEGGHWVQDVVEAWRGTREAPLSPHTVVATIAAICRDYGISSIVSDQAHLESMQEIADDVGLMVEPMIFTTSLKRTIWGEFTAMLFQSKVSLLDHPDCLQELAGMNRVLTATGVRYEGKRDDMATVTAMCCSRALQYGRDVAPEAPSPVVTAAHWQQFAAQRLRKALNARAGTAPASWWNT